VVIASNLKEPKVAQTSGKVGSSLDLELKSYCVVGQDGQNQANTHLVSMKARQEPPSYKKARNNPFFSYPVWIDHIDQKTNANSCVSQDGYEFIPISCV